MPSFNKLNGYDVEDSRVDNLISNVKYHFINTGTTKGDCTLLELENANVLVDLSSTAHTEILTNYFFLNNINHIDAIIITHYHGDHTGGGNAEGFVGLLASQYVTSETNVYLPTDPDYSRFTDDETNVVQRIQTIESAIRNACQVKGITPITAQTNDVIEFGNTKLRFLNSDLTTFEDYYNILVDSNNNTTTHTNYNNFSLVTEVQNINTNVLLPADIELGAEVNVAKELGRPFAIKKLEHHGVNHLSDADYLVKGNAKYNVCMQTTTFNQNAGRYESFAFNIINGNLNLLSETNGTIVFEDNGNEVKPITQITNEIFDYANGVSGFTAQNVNTFKNLGTPTYRNIIPANADLNDYIIPGDYLVNTASLAATLVNAPISTDAFKLTVEYVLNEQRYMQKVFRNNKNVEIYYRTYTSDGWGDWNLIREGAHISCKVSTQTDFTGSDYIMIPFNQYSKNLKFELTSDGQIKALTSCVCMVTGYLDVTLTANNNVNVAVFLNDVRLNRLYTRTNHTEAGLVIPPTMVSVTSGDLIDIRVQDATNNGFTLNVVNEVNVFAI